MTVELSARDGAERKRMDDAKGKERVWRGELRSSQPAQ